MEIRGLDFGTWLLSKATTRQLGGKKGENGACKLSDGGKEGDKKGGENGEESGKKGENGACKLSDGGKEGDKKGGENGEESGENSKWRTDVKRDKALIDYYHTKNQLLHHISFLKQPVNRKGYLLSAPRPRIGSILCKHNLGAVLRTAKKGPHVGKNFYGCPLWPNGCGFFNLEEEMNLEIGSKTKVEVDEIKNLEAKLKKLDMKNEKLKLQLMKLKVEVDKHSKGEKIVMFALLASWIVFAFSWMFRN
ncbi:hypothetical protein KSS87_015211 [Heliosperma pusillum]|nr:hypothetical protein KSS87_015211 [Heliosperma pusillum]